MHLHHTEIAQHTSDMVLGMQFSGFSKKFRYEVVSSALKAYYEIHQIVAQGTFPLNSPFEWNQEERGRARKSRVLSWYINERYDSVISIA